LKTTLLALTLALVSSSSVYAASYKVKSGDSLYKVSKAYNTTTNVLMKNNGLSNSKIYPGNILKTPTNSVNGQASPKKSQATPAKPTGVIKYSNSDVDLLARLITAEAVGEGHDAMLSVGATVVNRVQSSQYPNSISGVINQKDNKYYQFTPVQNGMINKTASKVAINAANEALKGIDPTKGALYFYDNTVSNKWLTSKPVSTSVGKLTFAF
jgi:spore germination cell wall hydrolase CwlJ-like protein